MKPAVVTGPLSSGLVCTSAHIHRTTCGPASPICSWASRRENPMWLLSLPDEWRPKPGGRARPARAGTQNAWR